jgi:hypothetical protein
MDTEGRGDAAHSINVYVFGGSERVPFILQATVEAAPRGPGPLMSA